MSTLAIAASPDRTVRYIFRCGKKGCTHIKTADLALVVEPNVSHFLTAQGWQSETVGTKLVLRDSVKYAAYSAAACPVHGADRIRGSRVEGRLSPDHKCDARCTSAKGHSCDCACGGANHGADWL